MHRRKFMRSAIGIIPVSTSLLSVFGNGSLPKSPSNSLKKIRDIVIYKDPKFYCIAPSIICRQDGEMITAFRRARELRAYGEKGTSHIDSKSQLVAVRSNDGGATWSKNPELIFAHPIGGTQGPNLLQLRDGTIVLNSYAWLQLNKNNMSSLPPKWTTRHNGRYNFLGGFVLRSDDGTGSWKGPFKPTLMPHSEAVDAYGDRIPMFNRGTMCEGRNGTIYWAARSCSDEMSTRHYELHLLTSEDRGETWKHLSQMAKENHVSFTETSLIETPKGDLVGFVRARRLDKGNETGDEETLQGIPLRDHISVIVRSKDGGKSFEWRNAGFFGYPFHALQLSDGRVWLTYGYRKKPYGIRARVLDSECTNFSESEEIILRDDGGNSDIGYPWSALLPDGTILTVYWINHDDGLRYIAGTITG